ncbi:hypothetical protein F383_32088 [Gossypium arboreum]|uniref:Uncharacterized protein n=1 Tax=Gossypium arboreum TaxID=29729 RepID=A0A0B0PKZ1_GOSAR|nr:hypothetical protein F383_32088 [Gossypium arboreum]
MPNRRMCSSLATMIMNSFRPSYDVRKPHMNLRNN